MKSFFSCLLALCAGTIFCSLLGCGAEQADSKSMSPNMERESAAQKDSDAQAYSDAYSDEEPFPDFEPEAPADNDNSFAADEPLLWEEQPEELDSEEEARAMAFSVPKNAADSHLKMTPSPSITAFPEPSAGPPNAANSRMAPWSNSQPSMPQSTMSPPTMSPPTMRPPTISPPTLSPPVASANRTDSDNVGFEAARDKTVTQQAAARDDGVLRTVNVFYGTDRKSALAPVSVVPAKPGLFATMLLLAVAVCFLVFNRLKASLAAAGAAGVLFAAVIMTHNDSPNRQGVSYGGERGEFTRGVATVTVPKSHQRGIVERPSILRFEFAEDKKKHIVLANAMELDFENFYYRMSEEFTAKSERDLLLFVHGFNVDFDAAVRRTAQIATDLSFPGVPVCYSWPSQGTMVGYTVDENNVTWTVPHLREFLVELAQQSGARSINIIAHSMGNRAVTSSISQIGSEYSPQSLPMFDQVVLAAPDVDADYFRKELAPRLARAAGHVTLYASSDDQALAASKHLHGGYPRAGESGANLVVVPDIETIDVSGIDLSLLGHSYYGSSESMLRDLHALVRNRLPAHRREGLISRQLRNATYWLLETPQMSELPAAPLR